ncbi:MAG: hypothetical protein KAH17_09975 [Bacteroidales bacterium]|nr:hypothetical protein [Bacteroidales bacterium]
MYRNRLLQRQRKTRECRTELWSHVEGNALIKAGLKKWGRSFGKQLNGKCQIILMELIDKEFQWK